MRDVERKGNVENYENKNVNKQRTRNRHADRLKDVDGPSKDNHFRKDEADDGIEANRRNGSEPVIHCHSKYDHYGDGK